jgi:hypothetical protein
MEKNKLEKLIAKYSLSGAIQSVNWQSNGNEVFVKGITGGSDVVAMITLSVPALPEGVYGVYDTSRLSSMLSVLGNNVSVSVNKQQDVPTTLVFNDSTAKVEYALSDPAAIPQVPDVNAIPTFDVVIDINEQFATGYLKATSALSEEPEFTVVSDGTNTHIVVGHSNNNTNKITLSVTTTQASSITPISFSSKLLKAMLSANKGVPGTMKINAKGIAHITFTEPDFVTSYYLVVKKEV